MKLAEILEQNATKAMEVQTVNRETITASAWMVGEDVLVANKQQGIAIYISLDKIVSCKIAE